ncbi:hypothetical protein [Stigmatella aurantiaca]|uniref:Conserved uncharacterized protein n=1 Tax=Stigmatella aurantiaca (strain DW4/3-1) TaxID=378806 RepID=Q093Y5_STIAD|nr:hypothetical protein [Stigmatella aurantiaca]ADO69774.1 conserved uncharacterized protein [Stigmatella aurantiaca DW4/3-1]EAU67043.1 hypothetical protein STIAU_3495 [Stigmatella aurantiaca DW4/3-1]
MTVKSDLSPAPPEPRGPKRSPSEEQCFRQIHPKFLLQKGRLTEMAFRLRDDEHGLSVSLQSKTTAEKAFALYTRPEQDGGKGLVACGTWAVTTAECLQETCDVYEDRTDIDEAHGSIDMRHLKNDKSRRKTVQTHLRLFAEKRGCIFSPGPMPVGIED